MNKAEVIARINALGIMPGIRVHVQQDAIYAAETVARAGIPLVEITMTVPGALDVISHLSRGMPGIVVGAGTVLNLATARRCVDAGAAFLTSPGLVMEVVEFAVRHDVVVLPGALTPTDVIAAWNAGADFVKIFPCEQFGGPGYIRALKAPLPDVPMIASGGVNQRTAANYILAGACALGIGAELIPHEALTLRRENPIFELARRFMSIVKDARAQKAGESI